VAAGERRRERWRRLGAADLRRQRARRLPGRDAELARQQLAQVRVGGERGRPVANGRQAADKVAVGGLGERVERDLLARAVDRAAQVARRLRARGQPAERVAHLLAAAVALREHPLLGEVLEQRPAHELERLVEPVLTHERIERPRVDPHGRRQRDRVTRAEQRVVAERAAQLGERGAQARAGALVEHVGPQHPGHLAARVRAGMQREPAEEAAQPPSCGRRQQRAVPLERQLSEHPDAEHRGKAPTFFGGFHGAFAHAVHPAPMTPTTTAIEVVGGTLGRAYESPDRARSCRP
jgi:hypothetical protein